VCLDAAVLDEGLPVLAVEVAFLTRADGVTRDTGCSDSYTIWIAPRYVNCRDTPR